jgi:tripartite-type tricarboxylate transporter receptor subunit TctC
MQARTWGALLLSSLVVSAPVVAQPDYPNRPIKIVVGFAAGGTTDFFARLIGAEIQKAWGQPVVVENRPGAAGLIATTLVAKAAPDGYTLLLAANSHSINYAIRSKPPYDPIADFTPVTLLASSPNLLIVRSDSPFKTVADYVAAARSDPGSVTYATSGIGTGPHMGGEQLAQLAGIRLTHVPYKSANESLPAVISGEVVSSWSGVNAARPFMSNQRVRALGIADGKRSALLTDVPTFEEQGIKGLRSEFWAGILAPAGLPSSIATKWNAELQSILGREDAAEKIRAQGADPVPGIGPVEFGAKLSEEKGMYREIAERAKLQVD